MEIIQKDIDAKGLNKDILLKKNKLRTMIYVLDLVQFLFG